MIMNINPSCVARNIESLTNKVIEQDKAICELKAEIHSLLTTVAYWKSQWNAVYDEYIKLQNK